MVKRCSMSKVTIMSKTSVMSQFMKLFCLLSNWTKVRFDQGLLWPRSTLTKVRFDQGPLWPRSASTKVCFDQGPLWQRPASPTGIRSLNFANGNKALRVTNPGSSPLPLNFVRVDEMARWQNGVAPNHQIFQFFFLKILETALPSQRVIKCDR
jgi:hypothetical protein